MAYKFNVFTGTFDITDTYFVENGNTLELWWRGHLLDSWSYAATFMLLETEDFILLEDDGKIELEQ
jgi:hypothetical protein